MPDPLVNLDERDFSVLYSMSDEWNALDGSGKAAVLRAVDGFWRTLPWLISPYSAAALQPGLEAVLAWHCSQYAFRPWEYGMPSFVRRRLAMWLVSVAEYSDAAPAAPVVAVGLSGLLTGALVYVLWDAAEESFVDPDAWTEDGLEFNVGGAFAGRDIALTVTLNPIAASFVGFAVPQEWPELVYIGLFGGPNNRQAFMELHAVTIRGRKHRVYRSTRHWTTRSLLAGSRWVIRTI